LGKLSQAKSAKDFVGFIFNQSNLSTESCSDWPRRLKQEKNKPTKNKAAFMIH